MPGVTKCYYVDCQTNNKENSELHFFKFPVTDPSRCCTWLVNSGRDDFIDLPNNKLQSRRICGRHFKAEDFTNSLCNRLNKYAVPIPYFECSNESPASSSSSSMPHVPRQSADMPQPPSTGASPALSSTTHMPPVPPTSTEIPTDTNICSASTGLNESFDEVLSSFGPLSTETTINIEQFTPRKKTMLKHIVRQKKIVKSQRKLIMSKRSKISFLKKKAKPVSTAELLQLISKHVSGEVFTFIRMQLKMKRKKEWSEEEKCLALSLYFKSPGAYLHLRGQGFKLPCLRTVQRWVNIYNLQSGFNDEVLRKISMKVKTMTEHEKQCVVMFDEMSIKKGLQYDVKNDLIVGFEDHGPLGRNDKIATHAMLFMLRGLKCCWKLPIGYVISENATTNTVISLLIDICLEKVFEIGLVVRGVVCDLGSTNAASLSMSGVNEKTPFFFFENHKIYCFYDAPHLVKNIRNTLIASDIEVGNHLVKWSDIEEFYKIDKSQPNNCRAAPKLSERHIHPNTFQKMKVSLATQVFSQSVSRALRAASHLGAMKSETAEDTADFVGRMNDILDALNSRSPEDKCPMRRPLSNKNSQVEECLKEGLKYIDTWKLNKFTKTKKGDLKRVKNPPCFAGLKITVSAVLSLHEDLKAEGNEFLLTSRLNQDPIENMFGTIRHRGGYNSNPTADQFRRNLQHAISVRLLNPPGTGNCEPDNDITIDLNISEVEDQTNDKMHGELQFGYADPYQLTPVHNYSTGGQTNFTDIAPQISTPYDDVSDNCSSLRVQSSTFPHPSVPALLPQTTWRTISPVEPPISLLTHQPPPQNNANVCLEDAVISYLAGWIVKRCNDKFSCETCRTRLSKDSDMNVLEETLIRSKDFMKHFPDCRVEACLQTPSHEMYTIMKCFVETFSKYFPTLKSNRKIHETLCTIIRESVILQHPSWFAGECKKHHNFILEKFVFMKIMYAVKWQSQDIRDGTSLKPKRKMAENIENTIGESAKHGKRHRKLMNVKNL